MKAKRMLRFAAVGIIALICAASIFAFTACGESETYKFASIRIQLNGDDVTTDTTYKSTVDLYRKMYEDSTVIVTNSKVTIKNVHQNVLGSDDTGVSDVRDTVFKVEKIEGDKYIFDIDKYIETEAQEGRKYLKNQGLSKEDIDIMIEAYKKTFSNAETYGLKTENGFNIFSTNQGSRNDVGTVVIRFIK